MPFLRKGVLLPSKGVDWSKPSTFIDDRSGFPQNMMFYRNELRKRYGKTAYESAAVADATQIMGYGVLELAALKYLIRVSKAKLEYYNTSTEVWDSIAATAFTGGDEDFFSFANIPESKYIVFSNGYDSIRKWTGSGNNSVLAGSPPKARYLCYLTPYLLLGYTDDGTTVKPWNMQWCDTDAPETWTGGNSGSALLSRDASAIQNVLKLNEFAAVYKEESLWLGMKLETSDIFRFDQIKTGIGLASPRAVADARGKHYFMGLNDFHVWNGIQEESIGAPVRDEVFSTIDREKIKRCFALHVKNLNEIWFFILKSGETWPQHVWKYNYLVGFWYYDTCSSLTAAIAWKKIATESWNDDSGTWNEAQDTWDSGDSIKDWEEVVFGNSSGATSRLDYNSANDISTAVAGQFVSKDFVGDRLEINKRWLQLDVWARGTPDAKLYVDYSTDYGTTWVNIPYTSSLDYITLDETNTHYRMYVDILAAHIRFKFRNAESGEVFYLRNFYPYYLSKEETKR